MRNKTFILTLFSFLVLVSCETNPLIPPVKTETKLQGAFIVNEGNFLQANGSLSFYSFEDHSVQNHIFKSVNQRDLGDVVNSMTIVDTLGFIVVNNSNKIEVISTNTWKSIRTIDLPAGSSPRHAAYWDGKLYVTNLFGNSVSVIDAQSFQIESTIGVGANPEEIFITGGKAFVANSGFGSGNTVSVVDLASNQVTHTLTVGDNPNAFIEDADGDLHVLCTGRWPAWGDTTDQGTNGGIYMIDPAALAVKDSLPVQGHPSELSYDGDETGYFLNGGVLNSYSTKTNRALSSGLVPGWYYSVEVDPVSQQIFCLDAKDYAQDGSLRIFSTTGDSLETHTVGIIPGGATFNYTEE